MNIEGYRSKIDDIDGEIADLIIKRVEVVRELWEKKRAEGIPVTDRPREKAVLDGIRGLAHNHGIGTEAMGRAFTQIMEVAHASDTHKDATPPENCARYWESILFYESYLLDPAVRRLIESTVHYLENYRLLVEGKQSETITE